METLLGLNQVPTLNAVLRALKKEEASLYSCVCSIADDARFVEQVAALYPSLPLFPNLRCGVWYVRPPLGDTCYFKSTDGHNGNWSFSTVRLNLNLAEAAAASGGCLIVDATKRGKRFPDAMSKTVPMWAAVLNRAVHRLRGGLSPSTSLAGPTVAAGTAAAGGAPPVQGAASAVPEWDCEVHLPPWVSENEANNIRQRLDGWVELLLQVGANLSVLLDTLHKPLRCMWVSQDSRIWEDSVAPPSSLPFTPIILIGASATTARQRRCLTLPADQPNRGGGSGDSLSGTYTYSYFPGAADDEESWACGLTAAMMWRHLPSLLAAGPSGIEAEVYRLLEQEEEQQQAEQQAEQQSEVKEAPPASRHNGSAACSYAAGTAKRLGGASLAAAACADADQAVKRAAAAAAAAAAANLSRLALAEQGREPPRHQLLPAGCVAPQQAAVQRLGPGIFLLGSTGLALSGVAAAAAPTVWQYVDAVLHMGTLPVPGMQHEPQAAEPRRPPQEQQQLGHEAATSGTGNGTTDPTGACRICCLPVRSSKQERHSLQRQLLRALRFAEAQLRQGKRLLVCCDTGLDASVCTAVACLLAFFRLEEQPGCGGGSSSSGMTPIWVGPAGADAGQGPAQQQLPPVLGRAAFSKLAVRQHLAAVSAHYPVGRPMADSLRQVYNFFLLQMGQGSLLRVEAPPT
ncbi:hypothetical protein D9Q98_006022 [Chlorella vulgaris]|uniref:Initiator tRNA phosphoribosyl transferase n=1 Tax=Chlorella vulgaris TaxID=3077 RepID=A0A9D4Z0W1_CHLVU|nr:hypothetical protein D9Q98_006022 [Chlorella vulgaris]